ncbi:MAG: chemotaxis protein CheW [Planctomycetaceae bacterium]|nr:chemotaxis protein CheW [Planctomycetales bacterium]MCB9927751.1 chemotaxis protein CheW [Planctomycetaceae bacterium]
MTFEDPELVKEFVIEANEHLADIETQLLDIEAAGANIDVELVNTVFRAVHSIKGAAGFMGFSTVQTLSHSLENVLNMLREASLVATSPIMDVMLRAADLLRNLINDINNSNHVDVSELVRSLEAIAAGQTVERPGVSAEEDCDTESSTATSNDEAFGAVDLSSQRAEEAVAQIQTTVEPDSVVAAAKEPVASSHPQPAETSIRVSVDVLDNLMNLAGELVLGRNQLVQTVASEEKVGLDAVSMRLDQITSELQEAIMKTRMQPIGIVFNKFTRIVRDLSAKLGKQCELQIEGKDVEVDKTIIEAMGDPLTHLVRNSVDHGVETPDERTAKGKPAAGTLRLQAYHKSGKVRIEISDDGKGIDPAALRAKAVSKGLFTAERADEMSDREAVRLIFHPGFSMAKEVTDVSGRGVGMDVVRSNIERLGGIVEVETQVDVGTTIIVTLPLTLAIVPSLLVECSGDRFAIPQVNIAELVRIRDHELASRIGRVHNKEVLRLRGSLLPLVRLRDALGVTQLDDQRVQHAESRKQVRNIIVVESGPLRYGLIVDDLFDSEEIVVKPLGRHIRSCPCLSGATILGDGRVALILDVAGIATKLELRESQSQNQLDSENAVEGVSSASETQPVLLFTSHPQEQFAVPMTMVSRIERIRRDQIDCVGGQELLQYRGTSLPLISLETVITARPREERDRLFVVVFEAVGHELGLIAPELVDIRQVSAEFDAMTFGEAGVCGSQVIDDRTTRALDLMALAHLARPEWFVKQQASAKIEPTRVSRPESKPLSILLAEDSTFFRRQVRGILESEGYRVIECEDGQVAWHTLKSGHEDIDLLLTDIEMPNMNGLQLSRHVKDDDNLQHIPVIALTSLAGQEDVERGRAAGVNEYQVKLDRDNLLEAVRRYAPINKLQAAGSGK